MSPWILLFSISVRHFYRIQHLMISQLHIINLPSNTLINVVVAVIPFSIRRMSIVLVGAVWCLLLVAARGEEQLMELGEFGLDSELRFKRFPQVSLL
jgi:hypothetical protein